MAAPEENPGAFNDEEDDLEYTEDSDTEDYEEDYAVSTAPAPASVPPATTNPNPPLGLNNGSTTIQLPSSIAGSPNPNSNLPVNPSPAPVLIPTEPTSASLEDSRRLFQRLWTDDDEIKILNGFLKFTSSRGTTFASHQYDTGPFYEQIKHELQLEFNKNQLTEKLRRLKKKYRTTASRMATHGSEFSFKSPHEKATYEIARKIWSIGSGVKRLHESDDDDLNTVAVVSERHAARSRRRVRKRALETIPVAPAPLMLLPAPPVLPTPELAGPSEGVVKVEVQTVPAPVTPPMPSSSTVAPPLVHGIVEEAVKSCISPIFKELLNFVVSVSGHNEGLGFGLMGLGPPLLVSFGSNLVGAVADDVKWKKQQILELEVYLKRVELVRDQIRLTLEELNSPTVAVPTQAQSRTTGS